ncbi:MAG: UvrD-helicase domain-containing protein, partial [Candidatus Omnitrophica bacterium]|nr:UvrD-helicase domain-containing protein [Candidatus Omnitrophota bacterium]
MENYKLEPFYVNSTINFDECLNPQQLQAVYETDGPCLVLAGAGSGKTRVLIYRLAYLLQKGVAQKNILLATFTNRASKEMIHRAETLLNSDLSGLCAGTFHHIGHLVLRKEAYILGYSSNFTIVDSEDAKNLITECFEDLGVDRKNKIFPKKGIIYNIYSLAASSQQSIDQVLFKFYVHLEEFTSPIKQVIS